MAERKKLKLCFAASSGGHLEQIMMLRPLMEQYDSFLLTERTPYSRAAEGLRVYYLPQVNRRQRFLPLRLIGSSFRSLSILLREKPDAVITTGVLAVIPFCLLMKLTGRKLIFIESFADINSPTRTGRLLYRFADRFYVQWESMLKFYPDAVWLGGIY